MNRKGNEWWCVGEWGGIVSGCLEGVGCGEWVCGCGERVWGCVVCQGVGMLGVSGCGNVGCGAGVWRIWGVVRCGVVWGGVRWCGMGCRVWGCGECVGTWEVWSV